MNRLITFSIHALHMHVFPMFSPKPVWPTNAFLGTLLIKLIRLPARGILSLIHRRFHGETKCMHEATRVTALFLVHQNFHGENKCMHEKCACDSSVAFTSMQKDAQDCNSFEVRYRSGMEIGNVHEVRNHWHWIPSGVTSDSGAAPSLMPRTCVKIIRIRKVNRGAMEFSVWPPTGEKWRMKGRGD